MHDNSILNSLGRDGECGNLIGVLLLNIFKRFFKCVFLKYCVNYVHNHLHFLLLIKYNFQVL